jgi:phosphomethylpyrimidine synthase
MLRCARWLRKRCGRRGNWYCAPGILRERWTLSADPKATEGEPLAKAEEAMAEMSKVYDETGRELYMGAGDREHD